MLITDIEISQYKYDKANALHKANVSMILKDRVVRLFCQLDLPANEPAQSRVSAFVSDAIRQLRRMPEVRSGQVELRFDKRLAGAT